MLANNPEYENKSLSKLRTKILQEFSTRLDARGIVFTKTRRGAIALTQWIQKNPKFADMDVKPGYVIGGGDQSVVKPMTGVSACQWKSRNVCCFTSDLKRLCQPGGAKGRVEQVSQR